MGRAEQLLDRIRTDRTIAIEGMIQNQEVEELFLDYKRAVTEFPFNRLAESDRKNLAKAISGFGNSEGGLIIWGVDCSPTPGVGDVPVWPPIKVPNPKALKTLLDNAGGGLTLPAHRNVENIEIIYAGANDGFVVTYVPTALNIPLQTLYPKDKQDFYIRAGSNFIPTPRGVLSALFGRSPQADFSITVSKGVFHGNSLTKDVQLNFQVYVNNCGRGITREIFFIVDRRSGTQVQMILPAQIAGIEKWTNTNTQTYSSTTLIVKDFMFPPGSIRNFFDFTLSITAEQTSDLVISVSCGGANSAGRIKEITIPFEILNQIYAHYVTHYQNAEAKRGADKHYEGLIAEYLT